MLAMQINRGEYNGWVEVSHVSGERPHAIELVVRERILDLEGNIKDTVVVNKDFVIHPSHIVIYPGETVRSQVVYRGKEKVNEDRGYVLFTREVPLPEGHQNTKVTMGITVMVNYNVNILMDTKKPGSLSFVSLKTLDSGNVELIMENKSQGRFQLENVNIYAGGKKIHALAGQRNSVMPGQKRRFVFKYDIPLKHEEIRFGK